MDESRAAVAAAWDEYRRAQHRATKKASIVGLLAVLVLVGVLIYFAVQCVAHTASSIPDNLNQPNMNGALRHSAKEMVK